MKSLFLLITLFAFGYIQGQDLRSFQFIVDSLSIDGINYKGSTINDNVQIGKPKYFTILKEDLLGVRIRVKLTKRKSQPKIFKIRVDLYENGKWFKAPHYIDVHRFRRFNIRREQCWVRTGLGYNAGFPINMTCSCWKPLKGKTSHLFYLWAKAIAN
jgi:hypothetical protein